ALRTATWCSSRMKLPTALTGDVGAANADPIFHARHRKGQEGTHGVSAVSACLGPHQHLRGRWTPPRLRLPSTPRRRYPDPNGIDPAITGEPREEQHRPPAGRLSRTRRDQPVTAEEQGGHPP